MLPSDISVFGSHSEELTVFSKNIPWIGQYRVCRYWACDTYGRTVPWSSQWSAKLPPKSGSERHPSPLQPVSVPHCPEFEKDSISQTPWTKEITRGWWKTNGFPDSPEQNLWEKAHDLYITNEGSRVNHLAGQIWGNNGILNDVGERAEYSVVTGLLITCWKITVFLESALVTPTPPM